MSAASSREPTRHPEAGREAERETQPLDAEQRAAERLLAELAELERLDEASETIDPRWLALCEGRLSEAEAEALERETPAAERPSLEAFRPLSEAFQVDTVRRLEQMRERALSAFPEESARAFGAVPEESARAFGAVPEESARASDEPTPRRPPRRSPRSAGRWPRQLGLLAAVLVAVVGAAIFSRSQLDEPATALPDYSVEWSGGALDERTAESTDAESTADVPRWRPGTELQLWLRPDTAVEVAVYAHAFLVRDGEARPWPGPPEVAPTGAVRLRAILPVDDAPAPGRWRVLVLLSSEPGVPAPEDVLRRPERQQQDPSHRRVALAVDILAKAF